TRGGAAGPRQSDLPPGAGAGADGGRSGGPGHRGAGSCREAQSCLSAYSLLPGAGLPADGPGRRFPAGAGGISKAELGEKSVGERDSLEVTAGGRRFPVPQSSITQSEPVRRIGSWSKSGRGSLLLIEFVADETIHDALIDRINRADAGGIRPANANDLE